MVSCLLHNLVCFCDMISYVSYLHFGLHCFLQLIHDCEVDIILAIGSMIVFGDSDYKEIGLMVLCGFDTIINRE